MVTAYIILLMLVGGERLIELRISKQNAAWAFKNGGFEVGKEHFKYMAALHTIFLFACGLEVLLLNRPFIPALGYSMLVLAVGVQILRYYLIAILGKYWNVRVIIVPDMPVINRGLYRYIRHPNYLGVIVEGVALPMIHTAWITALVFTVLNAWVLTIRIRCEERALIKNTNYIDNFSALRRFIPFLKRNSDLDTE
ncbi:MAG: hypothetical protein GXP53_14705 [Deltaproteobacteria bacterium]|nr:hypothetical protein [Deltaproteobacteria bacterium]